MWRSRSQLTNGRFASPSLLLLLVLGIAVVQGVAAKTGDISGVIVTIDASHVQTLWPNAKITLRSLATNVELSTVSGALGEYKFAGVLFGEYEVSVTLAGFESTTKRITVGSNPAKLDFQLRPRQQTQTVTVTADSPGVDLTSSNSAAPALTFKTLKSVVALNQDFQDALPLLPGVVRGMDGLIRIKGGRTNQANTLVNSVSVTDPFTGQAALGLPAVAVQSVQVLSNPFTPRTAVSPAASSTSTRAAEPINGSSCSKILFRASRLIGGHIHGLESASPHLTFPGPLKKGSCTSSSRWDTDTTASGCTRSPTRITSASSRRSTAYTQVDWNLSCQP